MNLQAISLGFAGLAGAVLFVAYMVGLGRRWGVFVPFGIMLIAACMALPTDWTGRVLPTVWFPLQSRRSVLFMIGGALALAVCLIQFRNVRGKPLSMLLVVFVLMGYYSSLLRLHHEGVGSGFQSMIYATLTLVPLLLVVPVVVNEVRDIRLILRALLIINMVWVGMCGVQMLVNPTFVTSGNQFRFVGLVGNPQHSGVLMAFFTVGNLFLMLNDSGKLKRFVYVGMFGTNLLLLAWTGSRTGMGMALIGMAAVLYTRLGRAALFAPIGLVLAYIGFKLVVSLTGIEIGVERLASTENTRSYAWWKLYTTGMENPLFGVGLVEAEKSENSWLYAFAAFGIGMLMLALLATVLGAGQCLRALRVRSRLGMEDRRVLDLSVGVIAMYFAGAVLEGYMVSRVSPGLCFIMVYSNICAYMTRYALQGGGYETEAGYEGYAGYEDQGAYDGYEGYGDLAHGYRA